MGLLQLGAVTHGDGPGLCAADVTTATLPTFKTQEEARESARVLDEKGKKYRV